MESVPKKDDETAARHAKIDAEWDFYAKKWNMDDRNRDAGKILSKEGKAAFIKHVFTGDDGKPVDYAEMRARYG